MPFTNDPNLDESQQQQDTQPFQGQVSGQQQVSGQPTGQSASSSSQPSSPATQAAPSIASGAGMTTGSGTGTQAGTTPKFDANAPTGQNAGWTNLDAYFNANSGNNLGQTVASNLSNQAATAKQGLDQQTQSAVQSAQNQAINYDASSPDAQALIANPQNAAPDQKAAFQKAFNASYSDVDSGGLDAATAQAKNAQSAFKNANTEGGRFALLDQYFGKGGNYTQGSKSLDNLLLAADTSAIDQAAQPYQDLSGEAAADRQAVQAANANASGATTRSRQSARGAIGVDDAGNVLSTSPIATGYQQLVDAANAASAKDVGALNDIRSNIYSSNLSDADLALLGVARDSHTYGVDPLTFLHQSTVAPSADTVATKDQQARLAALADLAGLGASSYVPDATKAGTYDPTKGGVSFDTTDYQNAVTKAQGAYEKAVSDTSAQIGAAQKASNAATVNGTYGSLFSAAAAGNQAALDQIKSINLSDQFATWQSAQAQYRSLVTQLNNLLGSGEGPTIGYTR